MKSSYQKLILLIAIVMMFFSFNIFNIGFAQGLPDYTVLAPLPGTTNNPDCTGAGCKTNFTKYLPGAFNLSIGIAAAMAFVMITFGGITYATSDAIQGKADGRRFIENAIWGLLLVIGAWVILNTINPKILQFNLTLPRPDVRAIPTVTPGVRMSAQDIAESDAVKAILVAATEGRVAPYRGPCESGQTTNCVNLNQLHQRAIDGLIDLDRACRGCGIQITGGTEGGHITHGAGIAIVDLSRDSGITDFVLNNKNRTLPDSGKGPTYVVNVNGRNVYFLDERNPPHFHVTFP